jgi:exonuclease SbcC
VRIARLRLQNFRQHADSTLEFDDGLTGIIGPNGAGKSTILEAIAWALYGNAAARGTRDSIRYSRAAPRQPVRVELDFDLAGHRYRIVRGLTSAELFLDGGEAPIANSITTVNEIVQRRLGMSRAEFFNTYFTGQKELAVMAAMGPTERAQFLSRVLGYERLRAAQVLVRDRRKVLAAEIAGLRAGMPDPSVVEAQLAEATERQAAAMARATAAEATHAERAAAAAALAPAWAEAQAERARALEVAAELKVAQGELAAHERELARLDRDLAEIAVARAELEAIATELTPMAELMAEFQALEALAREEGRRSTLADAVRNLDDELARLVERLGRLETAPTLEEEVTQQLEAKRREVEEALAQAERARTAWVRDKQEAETRHGALQQQWRELKEQREQLLSLGDEGTCPTCQRPLGTHFRTVLDVIDAQLETVTVDGKYYLSRLEQLAEPPEGVTTLDEHRKALALQAGALERKLAKVQSGVQELAALARDVAAKRERRAQLDADLEAIPLGYDAARHGAVRAEIERLAPLDARAARLGAQAEREGQVAREKERLVPQLEAARARVAQLAAGQAAAVLPEVEFVALRARHDAALAQARAAELAAVQARGEAEAAGAAAARAAQAREELAATQEKLDALHHDRRLHEALDRAFSDLRTDLNAQLRPELSEIASGFLGDLTDGRYGELELNEDYAVTVLEEGVPKPVISGGEEDLANLVLRLAISQMIAERAGQQFSLLILDEVFGSLDDARRLHVLELLRRLQDRFAQVIVITHIEGVRDGLDRVLSVRFDEERGMAVVTPSEPAPVLAAVA